MLFFVFFLQLNFDKRFCLYVQSNRTEILSYTDIIKILICPVRHVNVYRNTKIYHQSTFPILVYNKTNYSWTVNTGLNFMGPFICRFFFNNYLYYFPSVVGSPQIQRPSCMHLSKPSYIGYLISVCVWRGGGGGVWNQASSDIKW